MKTASVILILFILAGGLACKKTTTSNYTPECTGTTPKFAADVSPLIKSSCATAGCHGSGSSNGPGPLTTYTQIKNAASSISSSVADGSMPQNSALTSAQKNTILCWMNAGANND